MPSIAKGAGGREELQADHGNVATGEKALSYLRQSRNEFPDDKEDSS